jgi:AcrR family transcriptional regulator
MLYEVDALKYDLNKKQSKFAERVLADLHSTLFWIMQTKALENITVNEICEKANYPRATFYNYFDDIFDLLSYSWIRIRQEIRFDDYPEMKSEERTGILFSRCYDYIDGRRSIVSNIMRHNSQDGRFVESFRKAVREQIFTIIVNTPCSEKYKLPYAMIAEHYANTIQMVLEWCFIRNEGFTKEKAAEAVQYLLEGL